MLERFKFEYSADCSKTRGESHKPTGTSKLSAPSIQGVTQGYVVFVRISRRAITYLIALILHRKHGRLDVLTTFDPESPKDSPTVDLSSPLELQCEEPWLRFNLCTLLIHDFSRETTT